MMDDIRTRAEQGVRFGFRPSQPGRVMTRRRMSALAREWDAAPASRPQQRHAWAAVGAYAREMEAALRSHVDIIVRNGPDGPYDGHDGAARMFADVARGRYYVQDFRSIEHPFWDCHTWRAFRTVHDLRGHIYGGGDFTPAGEEITYQHHTQRMSPMFRAVIFSETLLPLSWAVTNHRFASQAKCLMATPMLLTTIGELR